MNLQYAPQESPGTLPVDADKIENKVDDNTQQYRNTWIHTCHQLKLFIGEEQFINWFKEVHFHDCVNGTLILSAPSVFIKEWIINNYESRILQFFQQKSPNVFDLNFKVIAPQPQSSDQNNKVDNVAKANNNGTTFGQSWEEEESSYIQSALDKRFTFDNFVVGKSNELAYAAAQRVCEMDKTVSFNPLFLYGGVGLGKTHLMHAIAWKIKECNPEKKVVYLSAEKFMYQFVRALRFKDSVAFKEQLRSVDILMIDDVQFISGKDSTQEEFFHTFNTLVDSQRQIVISADKSPADLEGVGDRLKSRMAWGLVADVHSTTYELRLGILENKAELLKFHIKPEILELIASKVTSNVRELEGALTRLMAHVSLTKQVLTMDLCHEVLRDLIRSNSKSVSIEAIQKVVTEFYNIRITDMHSPKRILHVARPRQIAMYLSKISTNMSLPEIGRKFGGRDHTTVIHAVKKIESLLLTDRNIIDDIAILKRTLGN